MVIPGDRRETRDPYLNLFRMRSGMDPGSSLRSVRDDGGGLVKVCGKGVRPGRLRLIAAQ